LTKVLTNADNDDLAGYNVVLSSKVSANIIVRRTSDIVGLLNRTQNVLAFISQTLTCRTLVYIN